jgi:hypothetical protein
MTPLFHPEDTFHLARCEREALIREAAIRHEARAARSNRASRATRVNLVTVISRVRRALFPATLRPVSVPPVEEPAAEACLCCEAG